MAIQTINDFRGKVIEELDLLMFDHAISGYTHTKALEEVQDLHTFDIDMPVLEARDFVLGRIGVQV